MSWRDCAEAVRISRVMTILFGILGLGLLMVVHELGHYLAARAFKMRVTRFSIGFGPALFRHTPQFPLTGGHTGLACRECHEKSGPFSVPALRVVPRPPRECV